MGIFLVFALAGTFAGGGVEAEAQPVVGGPCEYRNYPGTATIVSVRELPTDEKTGRRFEVRFTFSPSEKVEQRLAKTENREYLFLLPPARYPGAKDVERYGLKTGAKVKGVMKVIVKGTCTPVLFAFPDPER